MHKFESSDSAEAAAISGRLRVVLLKGAASPTGRAVGDLVTGDCDILENPAGIGLGAAFVRAAERNRGRNALVTGRGSYTYEWLLQGAISVRDHLWQAPSFCPGDRIVLLMGNAPEYPVAFYGTLLAGGVVVPVPPDAETNRLETILASSEAQQVLTTSAVLRRRRDLGHAAVETLELGRAESAAGRTAERLETGSRGDELAALFYTSGSTGEPKGVMLSHTNLLSNARSIYQYLEIGPDERALALLPFYHAFGNSVLQTHLLAGAALVLDGSLMFPESILDAVREHRVTSVSGVPDVFRTLLSRTSLGETELPTLRYAAVAGGRLEPDQVLAVASRIAPARFFVMYGQTEATARLAYLPPEQLEERYGSLGQAIPGVELQVIDEQGRSVPAGVVGEIRARGPNVMLGYWRDPEATAQTLRGGWLYTGDLATADADGFLYPQGRRNALVKIGGYRVHPREIEEFVAGRIAAQQVVVVPFEIPEIGTRLALFVQPWNDTDPFSVAGLRRLCVEGLPRYKVPEHIEVLDELPLNDALKVDRPALARRAAERTQGVEQPLSSAEIGSERRASKTRRGFTASQIER